MGTKRSLLWKMCSTACCKKKKKNAQKDLQTFSLWMKRLSIKGL